MKVYALKAAQGGFAAGKAFLIRDGADDPEATTSYETNTKAVDKEEEVAVFEKARLTFEKELSKTAEKAKKDTADLFEMEKLLLRDEQFYNTIVGLIRNSGMRAAAAAKRAGSILGEKLRNSNEYNSQRIEDIRGITRRLAGIINGEDAPSPAAPSILVADELSPARLSSIDSDLILGIVTAKGAPTSHVSILAGNLGIPYFYGSGEALEAIGSKAKLILDDGKLTVDPDEETFLEAVNRMAEERKTKEQRLRSIQDCERQTKVCANIKGPEDIDELIRSGAEGVGLFRSEFLFLGNGRAPSEEEQFHAYSSVARAMDGKETVIRTMDLGSDKKADWLLLPDEKNPALGCRGLRLSLREAGLFKTQLRALMRAAVFGNIRIMLPMITSVREIDVVRAIIAECAEDLSVENIEHRIPPLGVMVETPAAAMIADRLAEKVDFFSIGTNDLTQYTLALDREAQGLDEYYDPRHESIMRLIGMTVAAGHEKSIPTAICGELASDPSAITELIKLGVDELSVSMPKIAETKALVAEAESMQCDSSIEEVASTKQCDPSEEDGASIKTKISIAAPADGKLIPMKDIPDAAFSSGALGACMGIMPENGNIYAPCDGVVSLVSETKHAITFSASDGRRILVHVGIDTVKLAGKGFTLHVKEGDPVSAGDLIMVVDLDLIREAGFSPVVIAAGGL